jgi:hypothetical protein
MSSHKRKASMAEDEKRVRPRVDAVDRNVLNSHVLPLLSRRDAVSFLRVCTAWKNAVANNSAPCAGWIAPSEIVFHRLPALSGWIARRHIHTVHGTSELWSLEQLPVLGAHLPHLTDLELRMNPLDTMHVTAQSWPSRLLKLRLHVASDLYISMQPWIASLPRTLVALYLADVKRVDVCDLRPLLELSNLSCLHLEWLGRHNIPVVRQLNLVEIRCNMSQDMLESVLEPGHHWDKLRVFAAHDCVVDIFSIELLARTLPMLTEVYPLETLIVSHGLESTIAHIGMVWIGLEIHASKVRMHAPTRRVIAFLCGFGKTRCLWNPRPPHATQFAHIWM